MRRNHAVLFVALVGAAVALRIVLGLGAPEAAPFGYVYDFYHGPLLLLHEKGKLPKPVDCWQCYQPPLFTVVGHAIFAGGMTATDGDIDASLRLLSWFTAVVSLVYLGVAFLIVRHFVRDPRQLAALSAFLVSLPVVFLSSYAIESDLFCATLMLGAFYLYLRCAASASVAADEDDDKSGGRKNWNHWGVVVAMGVLGGMAALTKYSGLVILVVLALLLGIDFLRDRSRRRLAHLVIFGAVALVAGGGDILTNVIQRGELITGNKAWDQVQGGTRKRHLDWYEFDTFHPGRLIDLMEPDAVPGELKRFSVYNKSMFTSHYGQIYTDCSVFSNPTRHGLNKGLYPEKKSPFPS